MRYHVRMQYEFSDRAFNLRRASQAQASAIWEGCAADHKTFQGVIEYLVRTGEIFGPGAFCIVRLDRTVDFSNKPIIAWIGMVNDDMTVTEGLSLTSAKPTRLVTWPPK